MITSVSTLSPYLKTLPCAFMALFPPFTSGLSGDCRYSRRPQLAAATAGLARYTSRCRHDPSGRQSCGWWWRPPARRAARIPMCPPRHGPQVGVETIAPASMKISVQGPPRCTAGRSACVAGMTMARTPFGCTLRPLRISAATAHIVHAAVGAGTDDHLVDGNIAQPRQWSWCSPADAGRPRWDLMLLTDQSSITCVVLRIGVGLVNGRLAVYACPSYSAMVTSSTGKMPFFAPASMAMLAMVKRSSMDRVLHPVADEFHGLVQRAVHADHADDVQDDVLAADPLGTACR